MANEKMIKEMQEEAYSKGLEDAWELGKKICVPIAEGRMNNDRNRSTKMVRKI